MNQGTILTPVAKGYRSDDYLKSNVISEKVRSGAATVSTKAKEFTGDATAFIKRNPVNAMLIASGVVLLAAAYVYRAQIAAQFRKMT